MPGSPEWDSRADLVGRAMRLIRDGVVDRDGVSGLAARLGYSERQVHRQLTAEVGAGPVALARAQRAQTARVLLQTTPLPVTQIAFAAGWASIRQFNDSIREIYDRTPTQLRAAAPGRTRAAPRRRHPAHARAAAPGAPRSVRGRAGARPARPARAAGRRGGHRPPGVAHLPAHAAAAERRPGSSRWTTGTRAREGGWLDCRIRLADLRDLTTAVQRVRRLFDLDADPDAVRAALGGDPLLGPLVAAHPGLRSPGAADPHELALRAVLVDPDAEAALVTGYGDELPGGPDGGLHRVFPAAGTLAGAEVSDPTRTRPCARWPSRWPTARSGWTPAPTARRPPRRCWRCRGWARGRPATSGCALGDPDVFLPSRTAGREAAERWRPWRSYAVNHLWQAGL